MSRRQLLLAICLLSVAFDGAYFAYRDYRAVGTTATVIYIGLDSMGLVAPASAPVLTFQNGRWSPGLNANTKAKIISRGPGYEKILALISLGSASDYGHFISAMRSLRRRGFCNVAVRDGAATFESDAPLEDGTRNGMAIARALVLCRAELGDAGFSGTLPPDKKIRIVD